MKSGIIALALLASTAIPSAAIEMVQEYSRSGRWAMSVGMTSEQVPVCILSSPSNVSSRTIEFRAFQGVEYLFVTLSDTVWAEPDTPVLPVKVTADMGTVSLWQGLADFVSLYPTVVMFGFDAEGTQQFLYDAGVSAHITVNFPGNNIEPWYFVSEGLGNLYGDFSECVQMINGL